MNKNFLKRIILNYDYFFYFKRESMKNYKDFDKGKIYRWR